MTYTAHGHHIPFTFLSDEKPARVEGCGGVRMCTTCTLEAMRYMPAFGAEDGHPADALESLLIAHTAVTRKLRQHLQEEGVVVDQDRYLMFNNTTVAV